MVMVSATWRTMPWVLVVLGGCIGINPEWDGDPSTTEALEPTTTAPPSSGDAMDATSSAAADATSSAAADATSGGEVGSGSSDTGPVQGQSSTTGEPHVCGDHEDVACEVEGEWTCVDLRWDDEHCGACSHDCAAYGDASCEHGECDCDGGWWARLCPEGCADTQHDPSACGEACVDCRGIYGDSARCDHGECEDD
jgi:hypothetical protein